MKFVDPDGRQEALAGWGVLLFGSGDPDEAFDMAVQSARAAGIGVGVGGSAFVLLEVGLSGGFTTLGVLGQSMWLSPEIQGAFAVVAAGLADQGTPTGRFSSVVQGTEAFTPGQLAQFERQVASTGVQGLLKSRQTLQSRLIEHLGKLEEVIEQGGYTSSIEREIRNFGQQINAIDEVLKGKGGYAIIEGRLVELPRE